MNKFLIILGSLAFVGYVMIFAGNELIGVARLASIFGLAEVYQGCEVKSGLALIPLIGYYKCEITAQECVIVDIPWSAATNPYEKFQDCCNVFASTCEYTLMHKNGVNIQSLGSIPRGSCVETYKDGLLTSGGSDRVLKKCYNPYVLNRYSPTSAPERVNSNACSLPSTSNLLTALVQYGQGLISMQPNVKSTLLFDETSPFLDNWAVSPIEYKFDSSTGKYCSAGGYLYPTQSIKLVSGCYIAPNLNAQPEKRDCCRGEPCSVSGAMGTCGPDYVCHPTEQFECDALNPCPGYGKYYTDTADPARKTAILTSCINHKCVLTKVVSECAADSACPSNKPRCTFDYLTGIGVCTVSGEGSGGTDIIPEPQPESNKLVKIVLQFVIMFICSLAALFLAGFLPVPMLAPLRSFKTLVIASFVLSLILVLFAQALTAQVVAYISGGFV